MLGKYDGRNPGLPGKNNWLPGAFGARPTLLKVGAKGVATEGGADSP